MVFRRFFFHLITLISYLLTIYLLFVDKSFSLSLITISILYVAIHFSMIEMKKTARLLHFLWIFFVAATLISFVNWWWDFYFVISVYLFHAWLFCLVWYILEALQNRKILSSWEIIHIWGYIFTVFITLAYSTLILAVYPKFPYSCQQIYDNSDAIVDNIAAPFQWTADTVLEMKNNIKWWRDVSVWDALWLPQDINIIVRNDSELWTWNTWIVVQSWTKIWLLWYIDSYKKSLVDQVLLDRASVNMGICEIIVNKITDWYNKPVFQFSLILLMFVLFYPFVRVFVYLIEFAAWIVLLLLKVSKVYSFERNLEEVEDLL